MRRYNEAIEVRQGLVGDDEGPAQFLWRHRLWKVLELQTRWVETADWWNSTQVRAARGETPAARGGTPGSGSRTTGSGPHAAGSGTADDDSDDLLGEQEIWRVVAADGRNGSSGVYELARSWGSGAWRLRTVVD
ncbi:MAG: hypothetical protein IPL41_14435 [Micropruina sp.]|nr:hypothetical protein [Micropruina sp.]